MAAKLVGLETVTERLGVRTRTVQRLIDQGILERVRLPNVRRVLVREEDLERLIAGQSSDSAGVA
jgi:excisionase family DNA binding protein